MSLIVLAAAVILGLGGSAQGKLNFNIKSLRTDQLPQQQPIDQTININNWGLKNDDRKMLLEMKYKIDYLYNKSTSRVCPEDGWVSYASYCYLIIDIPTLNWTHARRICQMPGGDLVIISSAAENTFIFKLVTKQSTVQNWGVWLGFVRQADNKLCWIDDTPMANGYTAWGTGEPNKVNERCGNMFGKGHSLAKWNDLTCNHLGANFLHAAPVTLCKKKAN